MPPKTKNRINPELIVSRRKRGLSQRRAAQLLGLKDSSMIIRYETGRAHPSLEFALRLEILYRVPIAFLFPRLYTDLREEIRDREGFSLKPCQQELF